MSCRAFQRVQSRTARNLRRQFGRNNASTVLTPVTQVPPAIRLRFLPFVSLLLTEFSATLRFYEDLKPVQVTLKRDRGRVERERPAPTFSHSRSPVSRMETT